MDTLSYSAFKANLASTFDKVNDDHKPVLITRQGGKPAILISLENFQAYKETPCRSNGAFFVSPSRNMVAKAFRP